MLSLFAVLPVLHNAMRMEEIKAYVTSPVRYDAATRPTLQLAQDAAAATGACLTTTPPPPKLSIGISLPGLPAMRSAEANDLLERSGGCWRRWEMRLAQLKDADKFFRVAFMPCYGIFLAAKFSQIEAYAHADE